MSRQLGPSPSDASQLSPWQLCVRDDLTRLHQEAFAKRTPPVNIIQDLPKLTGTAVLDEVAMALQIINGSSEEASLAEARELLKPQLHAVSGCRPTAILQWRFDDESLWRGLSDNTKLVRLSRSMVSSGFKPDESVRARTFDLSGPNEDPVVHRIMLGDGQARLLAARLSWQLVVNTAQARSDIRQDPNLKKVLKSLLYIPTVFELHGTVGMHVERSGSVVSES